MKVAMQKVITNILITLIMFSNPLVTMDQVISFRPPYINSAAFNNPDEKFSYLYREKLLHGQWLINHETRIMGLEHDRQQKELQQNIREQKTFILSTLKWSTLLISSLITLILVSILVDRTKTPPQDKSYYAQ
jgi:hypothetical protein